MLNINYPKIEKINFPKLELKLIEPINKLNLINFKWINLIFNEK